MEHKTVTQTPVLQVVNEAQAEIKQARKDGCELIHVEEVKGVQQVNARELHKFLGSRRNFADWIKERIEHCDFVENVDYISFSQICEKPKGGRPKVEYILTIAAAKELSMMEGTERGKQARRYFLACEEKLRKLMSMPSYKIDDPIARARRWANEQEEKLRQLDGMQTQLMEQGQQIVALQEEKKENKGKLDFVNQVLTSETCYTSTQMAKELDVKSGRTLHKMLRDAGVMFWESGTWMLVAKYTGHDYTKMRTHSYFTEGGKPVTHSYTVWTEKGRMFLHTLRNIGKI